jgi:pSer/pThr/pTyr-binding forkhead associated (FHA) protein
MTGVAAATAADTIILEPESAPPPRQRACLTAISGEDRGRRFEFSDVDILIGRHPTLADVLLSDSTISAQHARIRYEAGQFTLYDLDSTNGSFVNGQRIRMQALHADDLITLGAVDLIFTTFCQE